MNFIEAILLGIIQGITEFLPISSTGHLTLAGKIMGTISEKHPEQWTSFIAIIQLGTMVSVLFYFRRDLWQIISSFIKENLIARTMFREQSENSRMGWLVITGTIPVVITGILFKDFIEGALTKNLYVISGSLLVLAVILAAAEKTAKFRKDLNEITLTDSFLIGIAQAFALIPGSSRSGTTITGGLFLGLKRETAARFSFLLSIPAILASGLLQLYEALEFVDSSAAFNLVLATLFSGISGYAAIDFLLKYLKQHSTYLFVYYRIVIGLIILILLINGVVEP